MNYQHQLSEFLFLIESQEKTPTFELGGIIKEIKLFCQSNEQLLPNSKTLIASCDVFFSLPVDIDMTILHNTLSTIIFFSKNRSMISKQNQFQKKHKRKGKNK